MPNVTGGRILTTSGTFRVDQHFLTGDINGDGVDDFVFRSLNGAGQTVVSVVYGVKGGLPHGADIATLNGTNGFTITSPSTDGSFGAPSIAIGDYNGDGFDDIAIGDSTETGMKLGVDGANTYADGAIVVLFGQSITTEASLTAFDILSSNHEADGVVIRAKTGVDPDLKIGGAVTFAPTEDSTGPDDLVFVANEDPTTGDASLFVINGNAQPPDPNVVLDDNLVPIVTGENVGDISNLQGPDHFMENGPIFASSASNGGNVGRAFIFQRGDNNFRDPAGDPHNWDLLPDPNAFEITGDGITGSFGARSSCFVSTSAGDLVAFGTPGANFYDGATHFFVLGETGPTRNPIPFPDTVGSTDPTLGELRGISVYGDSTFDSSGYSVCSFTSTNFFVSLQPEDGPPQSRVVEIIPIETGHAPAPHLLFSAPDAERSGGPSDAGFVLFTPAQNIIDLIDNAQPGDPAVTNNDVAQMDGSFRIWGDTPGGRLGTAVSTGDMNGDGHTDIIIAGREESDFPSSLYWIDGTKKALNAMDAADGTKDGNIDIGNVSSTQKPTAGVFITGQNANEETGGAIAGVGDFNGDGLNDLVIGSTPNGLFGGAITDTRIVFGDFIFDDGTLRLEDLDGSNGLVIKGAQAGDGSGSVVSGVTDLDGDGRDELLLGAPLFKDGFDATTGSAWIVNGTDSGVAEIDLAAPGGNKVSVFGNNETGSHLGSGLADLGDVNNDGRIDIGIGRTAETGGGLPNADATIVYFSKDGDEPDDILITPLPAGDELELVHPGVNYGFGSALSSAGDFNGDGIKDMIFGSPETGPNDRGAVHVVYGGSAAQTEALLTPLFDDPDKGFTIFGTSGSGLGHQVAGGSDVTGDGRDDLLFTAPGGTGAPGADATNAFLLFGDGSAPVNNFDISHSELPPPVSVIGLQGYSANAEEFSIDFVGDVNGDGANDFLLGSASASTDGMTNNGAAFLVFGGAHLDGIPLVDLTELNGRNGYRITGTESGDKFGSQVAGLGDFDGDDVVDFAISASGASPANGDTASGSTAVIFGGSANLAGLDLADGTADGRIEITNLTNHYVTIENTLNGDGKVYGTLGDDDIKAGSIDYNGDIVGSTDDLIFGEAGNDIIDGDAGNDTVSGGSGNDQLSGGLGLDVLISDGGNDSLTGGSGEDRFVIHQLGGQVVLLDFKFAEDILDLTLFARPSAVKGATTPTEGSVIFDFDDGTKITIEGQSLADVDLNAILVTPGNEAPTGNIAINGTFEQGQVLTADISGVADLDGIDQNTIATFWQLDGQLIPASANQPSLTLTQAHVGGDVSFVMTYTDLFGSDETVVSSANTVANVNDDPVGNPAITGTAQEGQQLGVDLSGISDLDGFDPNDSTFQWLRGGVEVSGATSDTYLLTQDDVGEVISVRVSYLDGFSTTETLTSPATASIANVNKPIAGNVIISGIAEFGETLQADTSGLTDADGLPNPPIYSYRWLRDGQSISGATSDSYVLTGDDVGSMMSVTVKITDLENTPETATSAQTGTVANEPSKSELGTPDPDALVGGNNDDMLMGLASDDTLTGLAGDDTLDGGAGTDTAKFAGDQSSFSVILNANGTTIIQDRSTDGTGTDTLQSIEFLDFDTMIPLFGSNPMNLDAFDGPSQIDPAAFALITELYIAYFNRAPDALGLFYWASEFVNGFGIAEMADNFFNQQETRDTYAAVLDGSGNLTDIGAFVTAVYNNVLGRGPDAPGFNYWTGELANNPAIGPANFILSILNGAKFPSIPTPQTDLDQAYLSTKIDIGAYYSVIKGLSDVDQSRSIMANYDGSQPSVDTVKAEIDALHLAALDADTGQFLISLVGVLDDPFAVAGVT